MAVIDMTFVRSGFQPVCIAACCDPDGLVVRWWVWNEDGGWREGRRR